MHLKMNELILWMKLKLIKNNEFYPKRFLKKKKWQMFFQRPFSAMTIINKLGNIDYKAA